MKYKDAQEELRRVLKEQKTIAVPKLRKLLESMNISLKKPEDHNAEVEYLKGELRKKGNK
ncbi:hypothetical protein [Cytobacillus praedii]|uniref:hypothetical protein n=1 Tax=Cytobacillus praedii TaxID=1742358 RepID=UPI002E249D9A|nr:hypothetical protein [Cytobacillus praedii]